MNVDESGWAGLGSAELGLAVDYCVLLGRGVDDCGWWWVIVDESEWAVHDCGRIWMDCG